MKAWTLYGKLVLAQLWWRPARAVLTSVAVIASACAVVWVVSGYDALVSQFDENASKYLGRYDLLIVPGGPPGTMAAIDQATIDRLRNDPGVLELNPILQTRASVTKPLAEGEQDEETTLGLLVGSKPPVYGAPPIDPTLVGTDALEPPYELVDGDWFASETGLPAAVLSEGAARQVGVEVGDALLVTTMANQVRLRVVGVVEQASQTPSLGGEGGRRRGPSRGGRSTPRGSPSQPGPEASTSDDAPRSGPDIPTGFTQGPASNAVYVRTPDANRINGFVAKPNVVQVSLRDGVTVRDFHRVWDERLAAATPAVRAFDFEAVRSGMASSRSVSSQRSQAWAATGMASVAAVLVIFSTLSMGVSERAREFAMLRAIALTRGQIAAIIALESAALALIGWAGGLLAGWALLAVTSRAVPDLFREGASLGWGCVALTGLSVAVGALGAAVLPAWRVMRIKPLDAMSPRSPPSRAAWPIGMAVVGLALVAVAPVTVFLAPMPDAWRVWCYAMVSYPSLMIGMVLLTPAVVVLCERAIGPGVAALLRLDTRLAASQLSSNLWRTIGATLALSVGLALYTSTQTWGYSMLQPFLPGPWLPDMLVAFHPLGLDDDGEETVADVPGVAADGVLPLAVEQARFVWPEGTPPARLRQDNAVLFGIDPGRAIGGDDPFLDLTFVSGERRDAAEQLARGGACVVSQDFQMTTGIGVGDELSFSPPSAEGQQATYRVAGVVSLPGWHWITKFSGVRRHYVRTAAIVFANRDNVRRDFRLDRTEFYWLNLTPDASLAQVEDGLQQIAERDAGAAFRAGGVGEVTAYRPFARATATETVRRSISLHADSVIWGMSQLPLVTLAIMSLAVANAVMASVRARTWEFGVLRAVGFSRGQLVRLVLAEALMIGLAACLLSLAFGLLAGWCGVGMALYGGGFFAGPPTFLIPWRQLALGFGLTLVLCLLAGLWPAVRTGRTEPLRLLQAGRASN